MYGIGFIIYSTMMIKYGIPRKEFHDDAYLSTQLNATKIPPSTPDSKAGSTAIPTSRSELA